MQSCWTKIINATGFSCLTINIYEIAKCRLGDVALGEIGLDYSELRVNRNSQMHMLRQLVRMAKFGGFPVAIHCWDKPDSLTSYYDCLRVLELELYPTHPVYLRHFTAGLQVCEAW